MSLYTDYQKKIEPLAKFLRFVKRHKISLISVGAVLMMGIATMVGIKGIVIEDGLTADDMSFAYGENYSFAGNAILGSVTYEYRAVGSEEWSEVPPTDAGEYEVRARSDNSFGGSYYSGYKKFSIARKTSEVKFSGESFTYGEKPSITMELLPGDSIDSYDYTLDDITKTSPIVTIKDLVLKNKDGGDVTGNYEFSLPSQEMRLSKRQLTVRGLDVVSEYSGATIEGGEYEVTSGSLAEGDHIEVTHGSISSRSESGAANITGVTIKNKDNIDVTNHYSLTTYEGSLTMTKREITVASKSLSKVYDGHPWSLSDDPMLETVDLNKGLVSGDTGYATFGTQVNANVGVYSNSFDYHLDNEENYEIHKNVGSLTISKRPLTVTVNGNHTYEGQLFQEYIAEDTEITNGSLVDGDRLEVNVIEDGNVFTNARFEYRILNSDNIVVTANYAVTFDGSGEVFQKRNLTFADVDETITFDGEYHDVKHPVPTGLLDVDEIEWGVNGDSKALWSGNYYATFTVNRIVNKNDGSDRTMYYSISNGGRAKSHLEIVNRDVFINVHSNIFTTYSGNPFGGYLDGSNFEVVTEGGTTDSDFYNRFIAKVYLEPETVYDDFPSFIGRVYLKSDVDQDVSSYCNINVDVGSGQFSKASLEVSGSKETIEYDGLVHTPIFVKNIPEQGKDLLSYSNSPSDYNRREVGKTTFTPRVNTIVNQVDGSNRKDNYVITENSGYLEITQAHLSIDIDVERYYDGSDESISASIATYEYSITSGSLKNGDYLMLTYLVDPITGLDGINNSNIDDYIEYRIYTSNLLKDVTDCYDVDLNIVRSLGHKASAPRSVADDFTNIVYDGKPHKGHYTETGLKTGDEFKYVKKAESYSLTEPGEITYTPEITDIVNGNVSRLCYYETPTTDSGRIEIKKRDLSIKILPHSEPTVCLIASGSLAEGDKMTITPSAEDEDTISYETVIKNASGKDVTHCYNLEILSAEDERLDFSVTAKVDGQANEDIKYDGYYHQFTYNTDHPSTVAYSTIVTRFDVVANGIQSHNVSPNSAKFMEPGTYTVNPYIKEISGNLLINGELVEGDTSMLFKEPERNPATLTIRKREITIVTSGTRKYEGTLLDYALTEGSEYTISGDGLASTDSLTIKPNESTILTGGEVQYEVKIWNSTSGTYVQDTCYEFEVIDGMTYQKADLTLSSNPEENHWEFDGQKHEPVIHTNAYPGDSVDITTDLTDYDKTYYGTNGVHEYEVTDVRVKKGDQDVSKYYNVTNPNYSSSIRIDQKGVVISLDFRQGLTTSSYDSLKDLYTSYYVDGDFIGDLQIDELIFGAVPKAPGVYNVSDFVSGGKIKNGGVDITNNYQIVYDGTFEIVDPSVEISAPNVTYTYNGLEQSVNSKDCTYDMNDVMNYEGYRLSDIVLSGYIRETGTVTVEIVSFVLRNNKGEIVEMSAVDCSFYSGSITITPATIIIGTGDIVDYVGYEVTVGEWYIISGAIMPGDTITFDNPTVIVFSDPGTYTNDVPSYTISGCSSDCYYIILVPGTITILADD